VKALSNRSNQQCRGMNIAVKRDSMRYYFRIAAYLIFPVTESGIEPNGLIQVYLCLKSLAIMIIQQNL
jgi:hypothetical protein